MIKPPERVEIPEEEAPRERLARVLAIAIVLTTLLVALVEFVHGYEEHRADAAGVEAQRLGIERQAAEQRAVDATRTAFAAFQNTEVARTQQGNALQVEFLPSILSTSTDYQRLQLEQDQWDAVSKQLAKLSAITETNQYGPLQDRNAPDRLESENLKQAYTLFARQDAANQERQGWEERLSTYAVILTFFAVSVYLFGLALTLQSGVRHAITGLAAILVVVGTLWTGGLQLTRPSTNPEEAATEYADGIVAFDTSYADRRLLNDADAHLSRAIELRPSFAEAYRSRSAVRFALGTPQTAGSLLSVTTPEALRRSIDDDQKAYDLGLRDASLLTNLGFEQSVLAIAQKDDHLLDTSITNTEAAIRLADQQAVPHFNRALALLARGRTDAALAEYHTATDRTVFTDQAKGVRNDNVDLIERLVGGTLTDLDSLGGQRPDLAAQVKQAKEQVVRDSQGTNGDGAGVGTVTATTTASFLYWSSTNASDLNGHKVSTQWYYKPKDSAAWAVLPSVSGTVQQPTRTSDQTYVGQSQLLAEGTCLASGSYRAEIYVDGHLEAAPTVDADYDGITAADQPDIGVAACRPSDWKPVLKSDFVPGFLSGYVSADSQRGAYVVRMSNLVAHGADPAPARTLVRDSVVALLKADGLFPGQVDAGTDASATIPASTAQAITTQYAYTGGQVLVNTSSLADGSIIVYAIFGPTDAFPGQHGLQAMYSSLTVH